jgi:hypothetical protein
LAGSLKVGRSVCGGRGGEGWAAAESGGRKKKVPQKQTLSKGLRKGKKKSTCASQAWISFFPEHVQCAAYIYFHCSYLYKYYNYSRTLCSKCWISSVFRRGWKQARREGEDRVTLQISLLDSSIVYYKIWKMDKIRWPRIYEKLLGNLWEIYLWWDFLFIYLFFVELNFCYKPALTQTLELFFWSSLYV